MDIEMYTIEDNSEGHLFKEGDTLKIEAEEAKMTIKKRIVQIKENQKYLGYWVRVKKLDGSYDGIRTVNEEWIKHLPLIQDEK